MTIAPRFLLALLLAVWSNAASAMDLSAEAGIVSDYRFRGISLSDAKPAAQASVTLEHGSGLYFGTWGSTIKEPSAAITAEVQLFAGYELTLTDNLSLDVSANYYAYPSAWDSNYLETTALARLDLGEASTALGWSFTPKQGGTRDETGRHSNNYVFAEASYEVPGTPVKINSSVGFEKGYFDEAAEGGKWDWTVGAEARLDDIRVALTYVGSDAREHQDTLVASLVVEF
ncbi:MAG TPA: TorF family putative porin [Sphingomicrobium sp.]|nr:TorF family putative porin [Sphingomicrobium sp.]